MAGAGAGDDLAEDTPAGAVEDRGFSARLVNAALGSTGSDGAAKLDAGSLPLGVGQAFLPVAVQAWRPVPTAGGRCDSCRYRCVKPSSR